MDSTVNAYFQVLQVLHDVIMQFMYQNIGASHSLALWLIWSQAPVFPLLRVFATNSQARLYRDATFVKPSKVRPKLYNWHLEFCARH